MSDEPPLIAHTKHGELTLDEIAGLLPGTGEVMASVSRVFGGLWHAAHGGNWDLASFYLRRTRSLLRGLAISRPKYEAQLNDYDLDALEAVGQACTARDLPALAAAYWVAVERANELHIVTGYPYIRWRPPPHPPDPGIDLGPPPEEPASR